MPPRATLKGPERYGVTPFPDRMWVSWDFIDQVRDTIPELPVMLKGIITPADAQIAVFCHGGFGLTWMAHLLALSLPMVEVLRGLLDAGRFPMSAYPTAYRFFFTFIVPVAFLTTVPAEAALGRGERSWLLGAALLSSLLFFACRFFWRLALRSYTSASS